MTTFLIAALAAVWTFGAFQLWRNQDLSRDTVSVTIADRIMAIVWLPICLAASLWIGLSWAGWRIKRLYQKRHP